MDRYLILALPRSRTAWLANFLTHGKSFCYHDPSATFGGAEGLARVLNEEVEYDAVGATDTGAILKIDEIVDQVDDLRLVYVVRDINECFESLKQMGLESMKSALYLANDHLERAIGKHPGMIVEFNRLNDLDTGCSIWNYCVGDGFDFRRYEQLIKMRIEVMEDQRIAEFSAALDSINTKLEDIRHGARN